MSYLITISNFYVFLNHLFLNTLAGILLFIFYEYKYLRFWTQLTLSPIKYYQTYIFLQLGR